MKLSIATKLSLNSIFLILLSAGVVGGVFYTKTTNIMVQQALKRIEQDVREAGLTLQQIIHAHNSDVLFLASTPPFQGIIRTGLGKDNSKRNISNYMQWVDRMETIFESLLERKKKYLKIRFINKKGDEQVVVRRDVNRIIRLRDEQLQNKAHRPYVKRGLKLSPGDVYLSEINLNREHRQVSVPHQEVLRIVTPVYDKKNNQLAGLVVLTVEIGKELRAIHNWVRRNGDGTIYITNDRGGYLLHPDTSKTYGFDLGKRYRIQEDIPQLAKQFLPDSTVSHVTLLPENTDGEHVVHFSKIAFDNSHPERFIAVIMTYPYQRIVAGISKVLNHIVLWALLLVIIGVFLAVALSIRITRPIQQMTHVIRDFTHRHSNIKKLPVQLKDEVGVLARAFKSMIEQVEKSQSQLEQMNQNLESMVEERTNDLNQSRLEAERANQAKSEFLSHMSHELRTPMNAILGFGQILELDSEGFSETQRSNIVEILDAGNHLLELINEILDLSRIESGKLDVSIEDVSLSEVVYNCITLVKPMLKMAHIELLNNIDNNDYIIKADPVRLKQVFVNLLSNAIKYNCENGKIILESKQIDTRHLRIFVTDTGKGLTQKDISKLFVPFERLGGVGNIEGTGIGLVITKHLVELMGGAIGVECNLGEGCTFWVEFTLSDKAMAENGCS